MLIAHPSQMCILYSKSHIIKYIPKVSGVFGAIFGLFFAKSHSGHCYLNSHFKIMHKLLIFLSEDVDKAKTTC